MSTTIQYATLATTVLIFFQVMVAVISIIVFQKRERKLATLNYYESIESELKEIKRELKNKYGSPIRVEQAKIIEKSDEDRPKARRVCNYFDRMCLGIEKKVYDFEIANALLGLIIINNYDRYKAYIEYRRKLSDKPTPASEAWQYWEKIALKIKKKRKKA